MTASFTFWVPGQPVAKARPRMGKWGAFTPPKTAQYEQHVWDSAAPHVPAGWPLDAEYDLHVTLRFKSRAHGDGSNVFKAVEDGLNPSPSRKGAWHDDKQVRDFHCSREYVSSADLAGALVTVTALETNTKYLPKPERKPRRKATRKKSRPRG